MRGPADTAHHSGRAQLRSICKREAEGRIDYQRLPPCLDSIVKVALIGNHGCEDAAWRCNRMLGSKCRRSAEQQSENEHSQAAHAGSMITDTGAAAYSNPKLR